DLRKLRRALFHLLLEPRVKLSQRVLRLLAVACFLVWPGHSRPSNAPSLSQVITILQISGNGEMSRSRQQTAISLLQLRISDEIPTAGAIFAPRLFRLFP